MGISRLIDIRDMPGLCFELAALRHIEGSCLKTGIALLSGDCPGSGGCGVHLVHDLIRKLLMTLSGLKTFRYDPRDLLLRGLCYLGNSLAAAQPCGRCQLRPVNPRDPVCVDHILSSLIVGLRPERRQNGFQDIFN